MTNAPDPRIAGLLRQDAPAERDPVFRIAVLGRIERAKYRRNVVALAVCALVLAATAVLGASVGGATREATGVVLIGVTLAAVYFVVGPVLTQLFTRFR
jgi:FtsH-binding integral membrane protein